MESRAYWVLLQPREPEEWLRQGWIAGARKEGWQMGSSLLVLREPEEWVRFVLPASAWAAVERRVSREQQSQSELQAWKVVGFPCSARGWS